jgi:predicted aldo/keto reductase-like oxidoreductase
MAEVEFDISYEKKTSIVTCPSKTKAVFTVSPAPGGYIFYQITANVGAVADELSGKFTSIDNANKAIAAYLAGMKQSVGARRDEIHTRLEKQKVQKNAAKNDSEGSKHLREGPDN